MIFLYSSCTPVTILVADPVTDGTVRWEWGDVHRECGSKCQDSTALSGASLGVNPGGVLVGRTHYVAF